MFDAGNRIAFPDLTGVVDQFAPVTNGKYIRLCSEKLCSVIRREVIYGYFIAAAQEASQVIDNAVAPRSEFSGAFYLFKEFNSGFDVHISYGRTSAFRLEARFGADSLQRLVRHLFLLLIHSLFCGSGGILNLFFAAQYNIAAPPPNPTVAYLQRKPSGRGLSRE